MVAPKKSELLYKLMLRNVELIQEVHDEAAKSLGVGSVILGLPLPAFKGDKADDLRTRLECPEGYDFVVALALGYATDDKNAHDLREENISRIR